MTIGISGLSASYDQSYYTPGLGSQSQAQSSSGTVKATSGDQATFSSAGVGLAQKSGSGDKTSAASLTPQQQQEVDRLKETDRRVRTHEQAHMAAGGSLVSGGAVYQYQTGPDGKQYAVGGEVRIDTSPEKDPSATLSKAERIEAAALAPADPSGQDRSVAASAEVMASKARQEMSKATTQGTSGGSTSQGQTTSAGTQAGQTGQASLATSTASRAQSAYKSQSLHPSSITNFMA
jgi:hypothetical protein